MRKPISKKVRFEVFKRDNFTCQYCSARPPLIPIEVDHIIPVSKGGLNDMDNLITACFDCNRGKGAKELTCSPETLKEKHEKSKLAHSQYLQYKKLQAKKKKEVSIEILNIQEVYQTIYPDYSFTEKFNLSVKDFIKKLGYFEVEQAMEKACLKTFSEDDALKYFCGICWNKIKGDIPKWK